MRGRVAMQRMHRARIVLLWRRRRRCFLTRHALHPGWRSRRRLFLSLRRKLIIVLVCRVASWPRVRLQRQIGSLHTAGAERIGLTDQTSEFGKRIALHLLGSLRSVVPVIVVSTRKRSALISISHRDDASP